MSMQKTLVTGGSGYFGEALCHKLFSNHHQVHILDLIENPDRPKHFPFFQADIRDFSAVKSAVRGLDCVYHNVAQVPLAKNKALFDSVNIEGTKNLLQACLEEQVKKVVYTSSSAVFGVPQSNPVTDETVPAPMEAYGAAKYEGEKLCQHYRQQGLDVSIIRPRTIMGHGRLGIFQILFEWIYQGKNIPVLGDGQNRFQFIHADDLAQATMLAGRSAGADTFNCGTDRFSTMRSVLENLCHYAGTGSKVIGVPFRPAIWAMDVTSALGLSPLGPYHALMYGREMFFDTSKLKNKLGWAPVYSNDEMFRDSYTWYVKNRARILHSQEGLSHHRSAVKQGILKLVSYFI